MNDLRGQQSGFPTEIKRTSRWFDSQEFLLPNHYFDLQPYLLSMQLQFLYIYEMAAAGRQQMNVIFGHILFM